MERPEVILLPARLALLGFFRRFLGFFRLAGFPADFFFFGIALPFLPAAFLPAFFRGLTTSISLILLSPPVSPEIDHH